MSEPTAASSSPIDTQGANRLMSRSLVNVNVNEGDYTTPDAMIPDLEDTG
jgi:hypothetical protein